MVDPPPMLEPSGHSRENGVPAGIVIVYVLGLDACPGPLTVRATVPPALE
jgi:hypothetical protein